MKHGLLYAFGLIVVGSLALAATPAAADSVGPYYATPSWDQTLPASTRFIVLSNFNGQAVLDRNTGLVWERTPSITSLSSSRVGAVDVCWTAKTGGQMGWRVPKVDEFTSLADPSNFNTSPLPAGHPFINVEGNKFWSIDHQPLADSDQGTTVSFEPSFAPLPAGVFVNAEPFTDTAAVWCVRGGNGAPTR